MHLHHILFIFDSTKNVETTEYNIIKNYIDTHCNDLTYNFWTYEKAMSFIKDNYPFFVDIMQIHTNYPIIKCDFFRYLLMYHFGGVYTDLDFLPIRSFQTFLEYLNSGKINYRSEFHSKPTIILSEEWLDSMTLTKSLHNGILISLQPKHPFWLQLLHEIYNEVIIKNTIISKKNDVFDISGTKKICNFYKRHIHIFADIAILPYYYFCPYVSLLKTNEKYIYNNDMIASPSQDCTNWVFFNVNDHEILVNLCPNSFFVCVFLNTGSMWK